MRDYRLSNQRIAELRAAHRAARDVREAYRINAVILLGVGWTAADVSAALLVDTDTVRDYFKRYEQGGLDGLLRMSYVGAEALLDGERLKALDAHLQQQLYATSAAVARYVEERWGVRYTASGMTAVLHRLGYSYKKAKLEPGKHPAPEVQEAFVEKYEKIKENKAEDTAIYFMDATHPQHNPVIGCGWIKRGKEHPICSNTGRQRLNINGAINVETLSAQVRFDDTIDAASTIALFEQI
jgi:transposase